MIEKKDKSMICRMAGNIAGSSILSVHVSQGDEGFFDPEVNKADAEMYAKSALRVAVAIYENADEIMGSWDE